MAEELKQRFGVWRNGYEPKRSLPNPENRPYTKDPRLRVSPRHGGQGGFLIVIDPPRGCPVGEAAFIVPDK